jgi:type 1 glutamine amidotransferase
LILSGGGAYSDPWHPFAETSERLAEVLRDADFEVEITDDVEEAVAELGGVDLIVPNAAAGPESDKRGAARLGVLGFLEAGGGVLAVHVGTATLAAIPEWEAVTGMAWVDGQSMHPKVGPSHVLVYPDRHPIAEPLTDFDLIDERYTHLRLADDVVPFVAHDYEGAIHPLVWAREYGAGRIVVDTLAHNGESFDSPEHRLLIARAARWATRTL